MRAADVERRRARAECARALEPYKIEIAKLQAKIEMLLAVLGKSKGADAIDPPNSRSNDAAPHSPR